MPYDRKTGLHRYTVAELRHIEEDFFADYSNFPHHHVWQELAEYRADFERAAKATGCWELFLKIEERKIKTGKDYLALGHKRILDMMRFLNGG